MVVVDVPVIARILVLVCVERGTEASTQASASARSEMGKTSSLAGISQPTARSVWPIHSTSVTTAIASQLRRCSRPSFMSSQAAPELTPSKRSPST